MQQAIPPRQKILILGGTSFFGKRLVRNLIDQGHSVTIGTRGITGDPFGDQISRIKLDREHAASLFAAIGDQHWDLVYDNICFSPDEAKIACDVFAGKTSRYIFTSTLCVYPTGNRIHPEEDFLPSHYPIKMGPQSAFWYGEGKRLAEAVFFQHASFPVCAVRFPVVLGHDDPTRRLHFHIERVIKGQVIGIPNPAAAMSYISSDEAARFLAWLSDHDIEGPINAASLGTLSLHKLVAMIEQATGRTAQIVPHTEEADYSPFGFPQSWMLNTGRAQLAGFQFRNLKDWYPQLISEIASKMTTTSGEAS